MHNIFIILLLHYNVFLLTDIKKTEIVFFVVVINNLKKKCEFGE